MKATIALCCILAVATADPTGTYSGSKTILGESINAVFKIDSSTAVDITISGVASVNCANEAYTYDGASAIDVTGKDTAGDCVHDALASNSVTLKSVTYDASSDEITVAAKYSIITVKVVLTKSASVAFDQFKLAHGKVYTGEEHDHRFRVFHDTLQTIKARNAVGEAHHAVNKFADLTPEEFKAMYLGYKPKKTSFRAARSELDLNATVASTANIVDWRTHSPAVLTAVKNQGQCGSCWAFSATEQIETDVAFATGKLLTLSPQQITSCDKTDLGCNGGNTETAYDYVISAGGLEPNSDYPYTSGSKGKSGTCKFTSADVAASITGYSTVSSKKSSESKMVTQMQRSPISVCVDAETWQTYESGIVGKSCGTSLDHCVQAVGLGATSSGETYWIVRNSWATDWGVGGYIYVKEGINACGIAEDATIVNGASLS